MQVHHEAGEARGVRQEAEQMICGGDRGDPLGGELPPVDLIHVLPYFRAGPETEPRRPQEGEPARTLDIRDEAVRHPDQLALALREERRRLEDEPEQQDADAGAHRPFTVTEGRSCHRGQSAGARTYRVAGRPSRSRLSSAARYWRRGVCRSPAPADRRNRPAEAASSQITYQTSAGPPAVW